MKKKIKLNELRQIIQQIIKEEYSHSDEMKNLKNFIIGNIDFEGYIGYEGYEDIDINYPLESLFEIFRSEKSWHIKQVGVKKALEDWIKGLPSSLDLPYYTSEIKNLLYSLGFEVREMGDDEVDKLFYNSVVEIILDSIKKPTY
jgi:hypothetical protein